MLSLKGRHEARGLRVVSVSSYEGDDPEEAKQIADTAREEHMTYPCFLDKGGAWQRKLGTDGAIPYFFVIGKDGRVTLKHHGKIGQGSKEEAEVNAAIERALAARP